MRHEIGNRDLWAMTMAGAAGIPIETTFRREGDAVVATMTTAIPIALCWDGERWILCYREGDLRAWRERRQRNARPPY